MTTQRVIAITGATGFLGNALVRHFLKQGDKVIALVRAIPANKIADVEYIVFDLSNRKCSKQHIEADVLVHSAFVPVTESKSALEQNTDGTKSLLKLFPATTKNIFISSVSADLNSPAVYGQQKAVIENIFLEQGGCAIRPGLILGNGGLFATMRDYLKKKRNIPVFNGGKQPLQTVYVQDLVQAIDKIISENHTGVFTFCEHEPVPYKEFYAELCSQLGVQPRFISIPFWVADCMVSCANIVGITLPINKDNVQGLKLMKAHPSKEDAQKLGVIPLDYRSNLARALKESI